MNLPPNPGIARGRGRGRKPNNVEANRGFAPSLVGIYVFSCFIFIQLKN